jgi:hypothetical protein
VLAGTVEVDPETNLYTLFYWVGYILLRLISSTK